MEIDAEAWRDLSVYRGLATSGLGEGPGRPVAYGEQFLAADPPLDADSETLEALREWLTLQVLPRHGAELAEQLEAWASFTCRGYCCVARLVPAGEFDRRPAYFAHARLWPRAAVRGSRDPGAYLGRSEAFEAPWRDAERGPRLELPAPAAAGREQVLAEPEVARDLLAHLYQALVEDRPVIIGVPLAELRSGGALHALVAFARAALPLSLKTGCSVRVYSDDPRLFLDRLGVRLLVVSEDLAGAALGARGDAVLIDRLGRRRDGRRPATAATVYAETAIATLRATGGDQAVFDLSRRAGRLLRRDALPDPAEIEALPVAGELAVTLGPPPAAPARGVTLALRGDDLDTFFTEALAAPAAAGELPWNRLLDAADWDRLPSSAVAAWVLRDPDRLSAGERALQAAAEHGLADLGRQLDEALGGAWRDETRQLSRLEDLLLRAPPLISRRAATTLTARMPLAAILELDQPLPILEAEEEAARLRPRGRESADLARLARRGEAALSFLVEATSKGHLTATWADGLIADAETGDLADWAALLLPASLGSTAWDDFATRLLDRLRSFERLPASLRPVAESSAARLDPVADLALYLRLADVVARTGVMENRLIGALWSRLGEVGRDQHRRFLLRSALDRKRWRCFAADLLIDDAGRPRVPWKRQAAPLLLADVETRDRLGPGPLLELAGELTEADDGLFAALVERLDCAVEEAPEPALGALIEHGWWQAWRAASRLDAAGRRRAALAWLSAGAWRRLPVPPLEDWQAALGDLDEVAGRGLSGRELDDLTAGGGPRWPWIQPFEEDQLAALAAKAEDLEGLALLAERIDAGVLRGALEPPLEVRILDWRPDLQSALGERRALLWLMPGQRSAAPPLGRDAARFLHQRAGRRRAAAMEARAAALLADFEGPAPSFEGDADLAAEDAFWTAAAAWLCDRPDATPAALTELARHLADDRRLASPPAGAARRAEALSPRFPRLAELLAPGLGERKRRREIDRHLITALGAGDSQAECWRHLDQELADYAAGPKTEGHPLRRLAQAIRNSGAAQLAALDRHAWSTLWTAVEDRPRILEPDRVRGQDILLPALELAAVLTARVSLGELAIQLVQEAGVRRRGRCDWWRALLHELDNPPRRLDGMLPGCDHPEDARARLRSHVRLLTPGEARAFEAAWTRYGGELALDDGSTAGI